VAVLYGDATKVGLFALRIEVPSAIACHHMRIRSRNRHLWPPLPASQAHQHLNRAWLARNSVSRKSDGIWLASFTHYDLGYFDLEQKTLQPLDNPFGTRLSPVS